MCFFILHPTQVIHEFKVFPFLSLIFLPLSDTEYTGGYVFIMSKKVNQSQRFLVAPETFQYLETSANLTGIQFREVLLYLDFFSMNNTWADEYSL